MGACFAVLKSLLSDVLSYNRMPPRNTGRKAARNTQQAPSPVRSPSPVRPTPPPPPRRRAEPDDSGEDFDFAGVSGSSDDEQAEPVQRRTNTRATGSGPAGSSSAPTRQATPAPTLTVESTDSRGTAADIKYFFIKPAKGTGGKTRCKLCQYVGRLEFL